MIQKTLKPLSILILAVAGLWLSPSALAENSLAKDKRVLSISVAEESIDLSGRYFIGDDVAVLALFGFQVTNNDKSLTDFDIGVGIRKYLSKTDLAPFLGTDLTYVSDEFEVPGGTDTRDGFAWDVHLGAEYFFHKQISAEGKVGIRLSSLSNEEDQTTFGTFSSAVGVNFYFP